MTTSENEIRIYKLDKTLVACSIILFVFLGIAHWIFLIPIAFILLNYFNTSIAVTNKSVVVKRGILTKSEIEIRFDKINNVELKTGAINSVVIYAGNDKPIVIRNIHKGRELKNLLMDRIEEYTKNK